MACPAKYMLALNRYDGNLYKVKNVRELLQNTPKGVNISIMSALYGLLTCDDLIQDYDLEMSKTCSIWQKTLPKIIEHYAEVMNSSIVVGLFGEKTAYNKVFRKLGMIHNQQRPVFGVHVISDGHSAQDWVPKGLGHALLYLARGEPLPNEFHYKVSRVRP